VIEEIAHETWQHYSQKRFEICDRLQRYTYIQFIDCL